jgi:hypothetical protein
VAAIRVVVARGEDLSRFSDGHPEVRNLFRALVHEEDHDHHLGMVGEHRLGDPLQEHGLAGSGLGDDEPALAFADRRDQVQGAHGQLVGRRLERQPLVGIDRGEALESRGRGGRRRHAGGPRAAHPALMVLTGAPIVARPSTQLDRSFPKSS